MSMKSADFCRRRTFLESSSFYYVVCASLTIEATVVEPFVFDYYSILFRLAEEKWLDWLIDEALIVRRLVSRKNRILSE